VCLYVASAALTGLVDVGDADAAPGSYGVRDGVADRLGEGGAGHGRWGRVGVDGVAAGGRPEGESVMGQRGQIPLHGSLADL
jgi:hypothetical protein